MNCKNCGQEITDDNVKYCPSCGNDLKSNPVAEKSEKSFGWIVFGFFFPIIGFILYLVFRREYPVKAKSVKKGALVGLVVEVIVVIIYAVISCMVLGAIAGSDYALMM